MPAALRANARESLLGLIATRRHVAPRRLVAPGPSADDLVHLLTAAGAAPDHGLIHPWRLVIVSKGRRGDLGEAFAAALRERDPLVTDDRLAAARDKASRGPLLMLLVARIRGGDPDIPAIERIVSAGCAIQNLMLAAHALGFGVGLSSGRSMRSGAVCDFFQLGEDEEPVCFVTVGRISAAKAAPPLRAPADFTTVL